MYRYRIYNKYSTKLSQIEDGEKNCIGYIHKTYNNGLEKAIDYVGKAGLINRFEVLNLDKEVIFKAKRGNPFKWRKYDVEYFYENKTFEFEMKQNDFLKVTNRTEFSFNDKNYSMEQTFGSWAELTERESGKVIAKWKIQFVSPFYGNLEILDEEYKEHRLFLLGIFHSYFYGE